MNESEFERELETRYADPQSFADEADFTSELERRVLLNRIRRVTVLGVCAGAGAALSLSSLYAAGWFEPLQKILSTIYGSGTGGGYWLLSAAVLLLIPRILRSRMPLT